MKFIYLVLLTGSVFGLGVACTKPKVAEPWFAKINVSEAGKNPLRLKIDGVVGDSARRVKEVRIEHLQGEINLQVVLTRFKGTGSGAFEVNDLMIDSEVLKVTFGNSRRVIWERQGTERGQ